MLKHKIFAGVLCMMASFNAVSQESFPEWLYGVQQDAQEAGISNYVVTEAIAHIQYVPNVIKLDRAQPEFVSPFFDYYYRRVDAVKIERGRELLKKHEALLDKLEAQYGVPKAILIAFWGMETNYGTFQGDTDTLSSLATLAYEGRRANFFRNQLLDAMRVIDAGEADVDLQGSWAGAFGHMQFMPSTLLAYAVDGDADEHVDIIRSEADALASAANYLSQVGWRKGEPAMLEVQLPENFKWQDAQLNTRKPVEEWVQAGVTIPKEEVSVVVQEVPTKVAPTNKDRAKEKSAKNKRTAKKALLVKKKVTVKKPAANTQQVAAQHLLSSSANKPKSIENAPANQFPVVSGTAAIVLPQGWHGPAFMIFDNFDVMLDWNRSVNYALSVAQLAKRINGEPRIIGGQSAEAGGLTYAQMLSLQTLLNERGFDAGEPDGFPGLKTQAAIRAYQLKQKLPADGYAGPSLLKNLQQTGTAETELKE